MAEARTGLEGEMGDIAYISHYCGVRAAEQLILTQIHCMASPLHHIDGNQYRTVIITERGNLHITTILEGNGKCKQFFHKVTRPEDNLICVSKVSERFHFCGSLAMTGDGEKYTATIRNILIKLGFLEISAAERMELLRKESVEPVRGPVLTREGKNYKLDYSGLKAQKKENPSSRCINYGALK